PASRLPAPSPYTEQSGGLTERCEPASCPVSPARIACRAPRSRPPPVPGTHAMALRPSSVPLRVPLPIPTESSFPEVLDPASDRARAAIPTISRLLATAVTDPSFESAAASALVAELLDFAAACRLDYATALVNEPVSASPPSVGGECALGTDVLEDRKEDFECLAAAVPRFASMLLAPEGDPDVPEIPTPCSYAEAITGPYSSQWQAAVDAEMTSWKSTGTYVDEVPLSRASIVDGMWIFRGVEYFQTFSPTPKMTTLRVLLHVAAQRDYELHSLDFSTAFLQGSLHEEIWLRRPPGFTGTFPAGTQWSLCRPIYGLRQAPREWHDTLRTTLAALGFAPSTADLFALLFALLVRIPPPIPDTHAMTLRPSSVPLRVPLPAPPESSLPEVLGPASDRARAASPTISRLLATAVTDPSFESAAVSALVAELLDFAAACRLDYATALVAESVSASPSSVGGECALGTDVLEDRQEEFECLAAAVPRFASMLLAPEGDPDAPDISTPCSYAEAITSPYSSQVKRPPGSPPAFKARYVARGFSQQQGVDYFQTFSPTPKMNTLRVLLHIAAQRDYDLHSLDFSIAFLQGSLQEEIWLRRPPGFTGTTLAALGFTPSTADQSLFLRTDMSLSPFYVLIYIDNLVFATADTEALTFVKSELQSFSASASSSPRHSPLLCLSATHSQLRLRTSPMSGMGLVLGGRGPVVLTGHADASSQGYTFNLGSSSVSWRSTRSSSVLSSSCEAEIYAGAMAAQELRWLTYLLTDLGEQPRSPCVRSTE
ncbi:unnamed protein product, partial [Closterium sp. NIES-53]